MAHDVLDVLLGVSLYLGWAVLPIGAAIITVFAFIRALRRRRMLWLLIILVTGPFGAVAYWLVSGLSDTSGPGGNVSSWPPHPRPR